MSSSPFPDRQTVADKLAALGEADQSFLKLLFENPQQDEALAEGVFAYLDAAAKSRFLNSLKLERCGEWLGNEAPGRVQVRLMEIAKSSQEPAYQAFQQGLKRSGGLERAYPKAKV
ncbi:hypothetical protein [Rhizobium paknamense]|uniref:Uncharacterized protein n=1 Tax=Rhizobium paknamense TaxID=1206817 RepID=A0ABU0I962_9HYPH|nr:hypothetical protein [Rhizobium paknamense]MDQ0453801.1 hypothetical protein [Rhizobium paknamense]